MSKKTKKVCAIILGLSIILSTGCKKKKGSKVRVVSETDPYYSCEEIQLNLQFPEAEGKKLQSSGSGNAMIYSDCVLWYVSRRYIVPPELQKRMDERYTDLSMTDEEREKLEKEYFSYRKSGIAVFDMDGNMKNFIDVDPVYSDFPAFSEDEQGTPKIAISTYSNGYYKTTVVYDLSPEGELVNGVTLECESYGIDEILFLDNGNMLCYNLNHVLLMSPDGKILNDEMIPFYADRLLRFGDRFFAHMTVDNYYASDDEKVETQYMQELDPATGKKVGEILDVSDWISGDRLVQFKDSVYMPMGSGIQKIDVPEGQEPQMVLSWSETDCDHFEDSVGAAPLYFASENDIYMTGRSVETIPGEPATDDPSHKTLLHFHREEKNPHAGKKILRLAYTEQLSYAFLRYVNAYNLDPDRNARIVLEDYSGKVSFSKNSGLGPDVDDQAKIADQIYLDILAGDGPDILFNFGSYSQFDTERALVDLNTLIDGESPLDRNLYYDNIFRAYEKNGKLYQMPIVFGVSGLIANKDYAGERTGWTYEEFRQISESLPPNVLMYGNVPQKDLLKLLMNASTSHFLDYDNREVKFDDPEFGEILDLVKTYGSPKSEGELLFEQDQDTTGTVLTDGQKFHEGLLVAMNYSFNTLREFAIIDGLGSGKAYFIGYPSMDGYGVKADRATTIAITKSCSLKDEAWDFLKVLFEEDYQMECARQLFFPVNRKAFDSCMEISIEEARREWVKAEEGGWKTELTIWSIRVSDEHAANLKKVIETVHDSCSSDPSALMIIQEEAPGYFTGQRTLDDVVNIIQKRAYAIAQERG